MSNISELSIRTLDFEININFLAQEEADNIRVFTYLIGKDLKNADPLRQIACGRRGYFTHIAAPADVKENVMQYFHVFNRRYMNDNSDLSPKWSQMYAESMIGGQKVHGIVLSSTVAVYNKSVPANSTTPLLGVVGTDLPLDSLNQENSDY